MSTPLRPPTGETVWRVAWQSAVLAKNARPYGMDEWCVDFDTEDEALEYADGKPNRVVYPVVAESVDELHPQTAPGESTADVVPAEGCPGPLLLTSGGVPAPRAHPINAAPANARILRRLLQLRGVL